MRRYLKLLMFSAAVIATAACSDVNRTEAPVELVATTDQDVLTIDLLNPPSGNLGTILLRVIPKGETSSSFQDVRLINYRVSYQRTDGGTQVPASFVRTTSGILEAGGVAVALNDFFVINADALSQAPFVAILPQNGGRDPETGQNLIKMDAIVDIFGETFAGQDVSARVRLPLWFCAGCTTAP